MGVISFLTDAAGALGDGVWSVASGLLGMAVGLLCTLITTLSAALPSDPFDLQQYMTNLQSWGTGIGWLNWFVPVGQIAVILGAYLAATVGYYCFQYICKHFLLK